MLSLDTLDALVGQQNMVERRTLTSVRLSSVVSGPQSQQATKAPIHSAPCDRL